jgi:lipopolysaccharide/colanic/teichoic acid biosynthesis glycosyltransferase
MQKRSKLHFMRWGNWGAGDKMYHRFGKRLLDLLLSILAILILSPLLMVSAIAIRLEDGGPALFRQERVGKYQKPFTLFKFRSMPVNTGDIPSAEAEKVRITRIGSFIRRTNIDELPQLFNIFLGDMSIVGPRPALARQETLCQLRAEKGVFTCKPGLTGLAQVNAYDNMPDAEKASWDGQYCGHVTLWRDVGIILRTFGYLLKPPPAY